MTAVAPTPVLGRLRSRAARLAEMVVTPLVPSDYVDLLDPLRSGAALRGRVVDIRPETPDAATVVIRPGRGWRGHVPGQYVRIGVDVDGVRLWRSYSLTSTADRPDGCICVTVKVQPGGKVSEHLVRQSRPGLVVQLDQAAGDFVLPARAPEKVLFVTAGSGITPVMGMLRSTTLSDAVVVHSAPTAEDVIFADELRELAATGRVRLVERHTRLDGHLKPDQLDALVPDLAERQTWACGPAAMLDALEEHWSVLGLREALHTERFSAPVLFTGEGGSVSFRRSAVTVEAPGGTALLDAGEAAGVLMPSGCRMGICFGCVVPLRTGAVRDLRDGRVTTAVEGDGVNIQTCINAAAGPCELDL
jgi:ferredoxin-NADP reductase